MAENTTETLIGGIVVAVAAGFLFYMSQATATSQSGSGMMDVTASFRSAEGVTVGTDVRMAGVRIGSVVGLELDPKTYRAVARLTLPDDLELSSDTQALISSEGLLGGTFVEIVPGGAPDVLTSGDEIEDTQGAVSIVTLLLKFAGGGSSE